VPVFFKFPRPVGRLGSGIRVSASFQIFAFTAGDLLGGGKLSGRGNVRVECQGGYRTVDKCMDFSDVLVDWNNFRSL